jgi:hypothetical protein
MAGEFERARGTVAAALLVIAIAGCGGDDDASEPPPTARSDTTTTFVTESTGSTGSTGPGGSSPATSGGAAAANGTVTIEVDGKRIEGVASECSVSDSAVTLRATGDLEGEPVVITVDGTATGDDWMFVSRIDAADGGRRYQSSNASEITIDGSTVRTTNEWVWDPTGEGDQASGDGTLEASCT